MRIAFAFGALLVVACSGAQKPPSEDEGLQRVLRRARTMRALGVVAAPDRTPEDRALD